jgi:hypothetical protein
MLPLGKTKDEQMIIKKCLQVRRNSVRILFDQVYMS